MTQFKLNKNDQGQFHFSLLDDREKTLLQSEMYNSKNAALNGIESVRTNAADEVHYDYLISENEQYYFNLRASNGQVIGTSKMYKTLKERNDAAQQVRISAKQAKVVTNA